MELHFQIYLYYIKNNTNMKTKNVRIIVFDLSKIVDKDSLLSVGIYKITNKINGDFYIGSSDRDFKERFKEHCRYYEMYREGCHKNDHPKLWDAYNEYGIENFEVELIEILDGKTTQEILEREEYFIHKLKPKYNICLYPTYGGKPNLGKKLTEEWKQHIKEKSALYRHSEETLKKVIENNKKGACKLKFLNIETDEELNFNSWKDASEYFNVNPTALSNAFKRTGFFRKIWKIEKLTEQKKKIKVFLDNEEIIFNSYSECDKYFNMWRGYTSELTKKKSKQLKKEKYEFEIL